MKKRSDWMEGLLWAEEYIEQGSFFEEDATGIETLNWELYYSGEYSDEETINVEWFKGAEDYLKQLKRRKHDRSI